MLGLAGSSRVIAELSRDQIDELLQRQVVARIGCHADGLTYVVPVIYALDGDGLYVASLDGQKIRMMRQQPDVCFEVDEYEAGSWSSAIGQGVYEELVGTEAEHALTLLAERFGRTRETRQHHADASSTVCFRIRIRSVTGRARR